MVDASEIPDLKAVKDDPILDLLQREYSMLQDKIDKIGGFRFTIKGWVLTLNTGALVAAFATALNPKMGVLLVSGLLLGLWWLELRQARLTELFQSRSLRIESRIMRRLSSFGISRFEFATLICCPGIASELRTPVDLHRPDRNATSPLKRRKGSLGRLKYSAPFLRFRRSKLRHKLAASDFGFYVLLWAVSVAFIVFQQSHLTEKSTRQGHLDRISASAKCHKDISAEGATWREAGK